MMEYKGYEPVIGLELHVELKTKEKAFCSCSAEFGGEANTKCCPVCRGEDKEHLCFNGEAHVRGIMASLALGCDISPVSYFDRKHYVSQDLPRGYQVTQYYTPLAQNGSVSVCVNGEKLTLPVERIQLEEDAGKLIRRGEQVSVDLNRCGVPLIEIVTSPAIGSAEQAMAVLDEIRRTLMFAEVSDCKMNEGSLRCDVNISVRPVGSRDMGVRAEIKNIGSVSSVGRAVTYELKRQTELILSGGKVVCETRRFDEGTGTTERMRDKESAEDYRYTPEVFLAPLVTEDELVKKVRAGMPPSYAERAGTLASWGVSVQNAHVILSSTRYAEYFDKVAKAAADVALCAKLFVSDVVPVWDTCRPSPEAVAECGDMYGRGELTVVSARELLRIAAAEGVSPASLARERGMTVIRDADEISKLVSLAAEAAPRAVQDVRRGKDAAKKVIVGQVMRLSGGRADPVSVGRAVDAYFEN